MEHPYRAGDKQTGGYNDDCKVYDRPDGKCERCGGTVEQHELSSRKVFLCQTVSGIAEAWGAPVPSAVT